MGKKRVYFVQVCNKPDGFTILPYAVGVLAAYSWQNEIVNENYELCGLVVDRVQKSKWLEQVSDPDIVAFSCYVWNYEYNCFMAEAIKEAYPSCKVIFGGHSVPIRNSSFLERHPYVDILIHGEGEIPFQKLLRAFCGEGTMQSVPNISYWEENEVKYSYDPTIMVEDYPSPYLTGLFDSFTNDPSRKCHATLETNRGCPFHCGYCDWGLNRTRLRMMNLDKIKAEIEWMGKNRIFTCNGADSNFGMFPRDVEIAEMLVRTKNKYGFPKKFSVSFSKRSDKRVMEICNILHKANALAGATLSFQSLNSKTLEAIKRENLKMAYFCELMNKYHYYHIPTYSEIILGLPNETYDSFADGLCTLVENGQYRHINVYNFALLVNSELGQPDKVEEYKMKTAKLPARLLYSPVNENVEEIVEHTDIVVATSTLSSEDWANCKSFASILKGFHSFGPLLYIATWLNHEKLSTFRDFYEKLKVWIVSSGCFPQYVDQLRWWHDLASGNEPETLDVDVFNGYRVPEEEAAFLQLKENPKAMYDNLAQFLEPYSVYGCWNDLVIFQKTVFSYLYSSPVQEVELSYDFIEFFNGIAVGEKVQLENKKSIINCETLKSLIMLPKRVYISQQ